jgi:hypothetical protein
MAELTAEQLAAAEKMPLNELRALALKEAEGETTTTTAKVIEKDDKGRFVKSKPEEGAAPVKEDDETLDNSKDDAGDDEETFVVREEIDLGDGGGVQVFEGEGATELAAQKDLTAKLKTAQLNATKKIRELNQARTAQEKETHQAQADKKYVDAELFKKDPLKAVEDAVTRGIEAREEAKQKSVNAQNRFVQTHTDFIPNQHNGREMQLEVQRLGYHEFTVEGLEKAYQSLKARGILQLKVEESEEVTEVETKDTARIEQPKVEATQPRSQKKGSSVSITRTRTVTPASTEPSLDEAYAMPLEQLRELANKKMAANQAE